MTRARTSWRLDANGEPELVEEKLDVEAEADCQPVGGWRPISELPKPSPGLHIDVRSVTTYRWLPYKPNGARQMRRAGRWQRARGDYGGWENAELPEGGEWVLNEPLPPPPSTPSQPEAGEGERSGAKESIAVGGGYGHADSLPVLGPVAPAGMVNVDTNPPSCAAAADGFDASGCVYGYMRDRLSSSEARERALREALEAFARLADRLPANARDHDMAREYPATPLVGDLRRARAALLAGRE